MDILVRCILCLVAFSGPALSLIRGPTNFAHADSKQCSMETSKRYPELFQSEDYIQQLVDGRQVSDAFLIKDIKSRTPFEGVCDLSQGSELSAYDGLTYSYYRLPQCKAYAASSDPCCKTEMYVTVPYTVISMYTGQTHKVKHTSTSYQFVHEGTCEKVNAPCTFNGRCQVKYRIHWMLVEMPNGSDSFVPVNIPNHCYCMYQ